RLIARRANARTRAREVTMTHGLTKCALTFAPVPPDPALAPYFRSVGAMNRNGTAAPHAAAAALRASAAGPWRHRDTQAPSANGPSSGQDKWNCATHTTAAPMMAGAASGGSKWSVNSGTASKNATKKAMAAGKANDGLNTRRGNSRGREA